MSGHSKWSTIKHQKGAEDKKRGKLFSKLAKAISIAAREGGSDVGSNVRLRFAINQAKQSNMPKVNVKRAIERGTGKGKEGRLEEATYEGFGPGKICVIVECITDNKNRTAAEIKSFFEKKGGGLGGPGSVSYLFKRKGLIILKKEKDWENQALKLIDLGVEDFAETGELIQVYTHPKELEEIKGKIAKAGFKVNQAEISLEPETLAPFSDPEKKEKIINFLSQLDDLDDVQKVYCNVDLIDE